MNKWSDSDKLDLQDKIEYEGGLWEYFLSYSKSADDFKGTVIYDPLVSLLEAAQLFEEIFEQWVDIDGVMEYDDEDE